MQFDNLNFPEFCRSWGIRNYYASVAHPQTNGQAEAVNKIIKYTIKSKLDSKKGKWDEKLSEVLWAYRTTMSTSIGETPFAIAFGVEVVIPIEMRIQSPRVAMYDQAHNITALESNLDELESFRDKAQIRNAMYQQRVASHYNSKVREIRFQLNDLVLRKVSLNTKDKAVGTLADKWEGPH
ncbi:hypothetical protein ACOSP7_010624 [Xanthoceras sorbifolium]